MDKVHQYLTVGQSHDIGKILTEFTASIPTNNYELLILF